MCGYAEVQMLGFQFAHLHIFKFAHLSVIFKNHRLMLRSLVKISTSTIAKTCNSAGRRTNVIAILIKHFYQLITAGRTHQVNPPAAIIPRMHLDRRIGPRKLLNGIYLLLYAGWNDYFFFLALCEERRGEDNH